jgi:hypothetical protein
VDLSIFEHSLVRFGTSGTLIGLFGVAEALARRRPRPKTPSPKWVHPFMFVSITAFYILIGPTGGPLLGGIGNVIGIALAFVAYALRFGAPVRYPDLGSRSLFYIALPLAVGVPWGWLALSLPACAASVYCGLRAERMLEGAPAPGPRFRMFYGVW